MGPLVQREVIGLDCYEAMFILRTDMEPLEQEALLKTLEDSINSHGGNVEGIFDWQRRRLAYEIEKQIDGQYFLAYFQGHGAVITEMEHFFRVNDAAMRYMIVKLTDVDYEVALKARREALAKKSTSRPEQPGRVEAETQVSSAQPVVETGETGAEKSTSPVEEAGKVSSE